jgi:Kynureninase
MSSQYKPILSSEAWQISNAPIMGMAPLISSMEIFEKIGMETIHKKGMQLSSFMEYLLKENILEINIITPKNRGCQLSIVVPGGRSIFDSLINNGVVCDWRNPDVIRVAPHPLFNTYTEIFKFINILKKALNG